MKTRLELAAVSKKYGRHVVLNQVWLQVRSGETVMLGGFISSDINNEKSGVPILKDIPLLGALFNSAHKKNDRTELVVLIRPTVLPTPEAAAPV